MKTLHTSIIYKFISNNQHKMNGNESLVIICIISGTVIGYLIARILFSIKMKGQRKEAIQKSKDVVIGQVNEKIAPILPGFPYNYKDLVFIGKGIDYIVFDGLSTGNLKQVVFLEIKSGSSMLNRNETMIKDCLDRKKVYYDVLRIKK